MLGQQQPKHQTLDMGGQSAAIHHLRMQVFIKLMMIMMVIMMMTMKMMMIQAGKVVVGSKIGIKGRICGHH